ncbi:MAG: hypothetical protein KGR46_07155 [Verrucomicrobia bacterium]|jgi:hypothetical protein|nr:hypothetical protein [Verrucomicrobiota bacterium]
MISEQKSAAPLPWLAGATVLVYVLLVALRFVTPPVRMDVEIVVPPPPPAEAPAPAAPN